MRTFLTRIAFAGTALMALTAAAGASAPPGELQRQADARHALGNAPDDFVRQQHAADALVEGALC